MFNPYLRGLTQARRSQFNGSLMKIPPFFSLSPRQRYKSKAEEEKSWPSPGRRTEGGGGQRAEKIIIIRRGFVGWPVGCSSKRVAGGERLTYICTRCSSR